jgi:NAD(P)H-nitrite reductase large subunit
MAKATHRVIIGIGIAGNRAAETLRQQDPDCRITMITLSRLPFYNRYDLPNVFHGWHDWRKLLAHPPAYYEDHRFTLRRDTRVINVDGRERRVTLAHNEEIHYDQVVVCSGGRGYLPEELSDYTHLMDGFASFEAAMTVYRRLPPGGHVVMLGGDMIGLDLARVLIETGYRVTLVVNDYTFWPHRVAAGDRGRFLEALERVGIGLYDGAPLEVIAEGTEGAAPRRLTFKDGGSLDGDVVMPFYGLVPSVEFMLGSGVDIERGLLVNPQLTTTNEDIWAAGDVCQIWSAEENAYRFYYGWNNVRAMGEVAARNMCGEAGDFQGGGDESLCLDRKGHIDSPLWRHDRDGRA